MTAEYVYNIQYVISTEPHLYNKQRPCWLLLAVLIYITSRQKPRPQNGMEQHVSCQQSDVARHGAHAEEVKQEVTCVLGTDAVVHPDTVVVKTLDTSVANP